MDVKTNVVIPAHDEEAVIGACLERLLAEADPGEFRVVVVCNGCTDRTSDLVALKSRVYSEQEIVCIDEPRPSKTVALNQGISSSGPGPIIFLDADVLLSTQAARSLIQALQPAEVMAASTTIRLDTEGCSSVSRSYHRYWAELPSIKGGLAGRGVYALSETALCRFGRQFPDVVADDRYVDLLFRPSERAIVGEVSTVRAARTASLLLQRKVRVFAGNTELQALLPPAERGKGWKRVVKDNPVRIIDLAAYLSLNAVAKLQARYVGNQGAVRWNGVESACHELR